VKDNEVGQFSDETLMEFADGVLEEPQFSAVANAIETNPMLAERVHALAEGADLARRGYAELLQSVPLELQANVRSAIARRDRAPWWRRAWQALDLTPAGLAVGALTMVALAVPVLVLFGQFDRSAPSVGLSGPQLAAALATVPAGTSAALGNGITMVPVSTFTDGEGQLCREFETSGSSAYVAIACRLNGDWQTRFAVAVQSDAAYRPASGLAALEIYLEAIGAGPALLDQAEIDALRE
jgi:hypothetical protein